MAKAIKPSGGAQAAETTHQPDPAQGATAAAMTTEAGATTTTDAVETEATPTPEQIDAQVEELQKTLFSPVSSVRNARLQAERANEEESTENPDADSTAEAPVEEPPKKNLSQSDAPGGGEKGSRSEPTTDEPKPDAAADASATGDRFVPGAAPALTTADVEATARRAAREEMDARGDDEPRVTAVSAVPDNETLSDAAQDQLVVLQEMAALSAAHRELPNRVRAFWRKEEKYRAQWEQANPGMAFDSNAADHGEFYRKNEPFVPPRDFKAAERSIIAREAEERAVNRVRKEQEPRLREIELKELERETGPAIANAMADAAEEVFAAAPQFAGAFKPKALDRAAVEKMETINPALALIAREEAERTALLVSELEKLDRLQGHYPVDKAKMQMLTNGDVIAPHAVLEQAYAETEKAQLQKPAAEQLRDGKKLIPFEQAIERAERIRKDPKLRPDQRAAAMNSLNQSFWWIQADDVKKHIIGKSTARVGKFAASLSKTTKPDATSTAANDDEKKAAAAVALKTVAEAKRQGGKAGLNRGTSTASVSDAADNAPKAQSEAQKAQDYLVKAAFR